MSNVTTLLDAKSVPEAKAALICPSRNETYSYKKLRDEMNRVGLGLLSLGVKKGDRVCIYLDSSPEYLISYFAIWRIGAVAVPTNIVYRGKELLHVINDAGACTVITDSQGAGIIGTIRKEAPTISHIICTGGACDGSVAWDSFPPAPENTRAVNCSTRRPLPYPVHGRHDRQAQGSHAHPRQLDDRPRYRAGRPPSPPGRCLPRHLSRWAMSGCRGDSAVIRAGGTYVMMERFDPERYLALARQVQGHRACRDAAGHPFARPLPARYRRAARDCPGDHLRGRPAPAGGLGSLRQALPYPGRELVRALGDDRDRFRYHHAPRVSPPDKELPERGGGGRVYRDPDRGFRRSGTGASRTASAGKSPSAGRPWQRGTGTCRKRPARYSGRTAGS